MRWTTAEEAGFDAFRLDRAWEVLARAAGTEAVPAAVAAVGRPGAAVGPRAFGWAVYAPEHARVAARPDTLFDLASLTKGVATATAVWALVDRGLLRLADRLADHVPAFAEARAAEERRWRRDVTVFHLLTHTAGFPGRTTIVSVDGNAEARWRAVAAAVPEAAPGHRFAYSDVGFMLLGRLVEAVAGLPLDAFCRQNLYLPLAMEETTFNPSPALARRAAATEWLDGDRARDAGFLRGGVHDWKARWLGGVAGHAGLFSTAADLAPFADMLLQAGRDRGAKARRVLSAAAVEQMTQPVTLPGGLRRTRGWQGTGRADLPAPGDLWTDSVFGHNGFTGTSLWADPVLGVWAVLLTNAVHLRRATAGATMTRLRRHFHNAVVAALAD